MVSSSKLPLGLPAGNGLPRRAPTLADQAYDTLRHWIVEGWLEPDALFSENELARRFEISRTPLREAVRRLQAESLLSSAGSQGLYVPALTVSFVEDVYDVRHALEVTAARTARHIDRGKLPGIERELTSMGDSLKEGRQVDFTVFDFAFHDIFVEGSGNRILIEALRALRGNLVRCINYAGSLEEHLRLSHNEHLVIMTALVHQDAEELERAVDVHVGNVKKRLCAALLDNGMSVE